MLQLRLTGCVQAFAAVLIVGRPVFAADLCASVMDYARMPLMAASVSATNLSTGKSYAAKSDKSGTPVRALMNFPLSFLLILGMSQANGLEVVSGLEYQTIRYRAVVGDLTQETFESMALEYLSAREVTLGLFVAYASMEDRASAGPGALDHCPYSLWSSKLERLNRTKACPRLMEAAKLGPNILLLQLNRDCKRTSKLILGKSNPLELPVFGGELEVLDIGFSRLSSSPKERRLWSGFGLRSHGMISTEVAKAAIAEIQRATGVQRIMVELRSDLWFKGSCGFPTFFPFEERPKPPTAAEFSKTGSVSCMAFSGGDVRCSERKLE